MDWSPSTAKDYLSLFAEVSIATVALSGIIMVLAVSGKKLPAERVAQIATQLRIALIVTVMSLLPLLLINFQLEPNLIWRVVSGIYIGIMIYVGVSTSLGRATYAHSLPVKTQNALQLMGGCALVLMGLNLWLAVPWPYLLQLMIALIVSMGLFVDFIYKILIENTEDSQ
jgi:hypothetical protein